MIASSASPERAHALGVLALPVVELGVEQQAVRPITPFIGVRISWLIVARNADFAREPPGPRPGPGPGPRAPGLPSASSRAVRTTTRPKMAHSPTSPSRARTSRSRRPVTSSSARTRAAAARRGPPARGGPTGAARVGAPTLERWRHAEAISSPPSIQPRSTTPTTDPSGTRKGRPGRRSASSPPRAKGTPRAAGSGAPRARAGPARAAPRPGPGSREDGAGERRDVPSSTMSRIETLHSTITLTTTTVSASIPASMSGPPPTAAGQRDHHHGGDQAEVARVVGHVGDGHVRLVAGPGHRHPQHLAERVGGEPAADQQRHGRRALAPRDTEPGRDSAPTMTSR